MKIAHTFALSLCLVSRLGAQQDTAETQKNPFAGDGGAVAAGHKLYDQACQACHGQAARGDRGPALATGTFRHGGADGQIFTSIRGGIRGTQMPAFAQFSSEQVWQLVSYIRSLAGPDAVHERVAGDAAAGRKVFAGAGQCLNCHTVYGQGVPVGPDLTSAGQMSVATLETHIVNPNAPPSGGRGGWFRRPPVTVVATAADGREYRGVRKNEDSFSLQMVDTAGQIRLFDKSKLAGLRVEARSLMPADYSSRLSSAQIRDLVAYLKTLNGPDRAKISVVSEATASEPGGIPYERIRDARSEPQNWLTYWGDYGGQFFSPLSEIGAGNVRQLQARWAVQLPGDAIVESIPLVADGIMYTTGMPGQVLALDARTGREIWRYERKQKVVNPYEINRVNRGVAILGDRLFFGTLDAALVALDRRSGALLWEIQVADTMLGYSITSPPLALKDKIITGISGGEFGIRGFIDAYDPATGKRLWRFNTIPGPGEFGHDTWEGESWRHGSGPTWLTGSYDAELNTIYWTVGNPGPDENGDVRKGDNLFTCAVVALDAETGKRKWHYQFTPNDTHDWDATEDVVLVDRVYKGQMRKLLLQADRNGVFYVLDRTNGQLLSATPYVRASWVKGWDDKGRPITTPGSQSTPEGALVYPSLGGGSNFQAPSYSPLTGWLYAAYYDGSSNYASGPAPYEAGRQFFGAGTGRGGRDRPRDDSQGVMAIDPDTGKVQWKFPLTQISLQAGVLATAGGVVFAASAEGNLIALDAKTGKPLWSFQAGSSITSSPMSYAVDGKQFVAISTANVLYSFALPE
ncbi:MAG: PQQ-dependent dehydrogenase, methanol/ethanol family [Bryobacteraceae bacterium]|jgi:alcohol dehydrogenase (cytochrome c)